MIASARRPASCVCKLPSGSCLAAQRCRTTALLRLPNDTLANIRYERTRCFSSEYVKPYEAIINHACHVSGRVLPARRPPQCRSSASHPIPKQTQSRLRTTSDRSAACQTDAAAVNQTAPSRPCFALCWVPFAEVRRNAGLIHACSQIMAWRMRPRASSFSIKWSRPVGVSAATRSTPHRFQLRETRWGSFRCRRAARQRSQLPRP